MGEAAGSVEATGVDVEAAVAKGLRALGVARDEVQVDVLDQPSRGVLGIGAREARVRLTVRRELAAGVGLDEGADAAEAVEEFSEEELPEGDEEARVARAVLLELLQQMGVEDFTVEARRAEAVEGQGAASLVLDVSAPHDDLIGPRGETLSALQHITRLMVGREQEGYMDLLVDVNGYKSRRQQALHKLALRLAKQAVETDRTVVLEPMPPDERRIIHLVLRDHPDVRTESIGEGNRRKVTIIPR